MIRNVLVAYDGSESAAKAYRFGLELARKFDAGLLVLAVVRPPDFATEVETEAIVENSQRYHEQLLAPLRQQAQALGIEPRLEVAIGHPAEQIIYHAETNGVDHIVMGHRGKTLFQRWRLGSVSKQVIHYAHCAVTVVR